MKKRSRCSHFVLAAMLAGSTVSARASWLDKQQPVPQWGLDAAKTHTPEYVGNAASVILFDEIVDTMDSQGGITQHERKALRILKPQGRDDAYCYVSYDVDQKLNYLREWTIGADERQYTAKDTDFADIGDPSVPIELSTMKVRAVRPPAADPGATILCESDKLLPGYMQEEVWRIQDEIPRVDQAFELDLPAEANYAVDWHRYAAVAPSQVAPGHWRWEIKDVHALDLRDVPSTLDEAALDARVSIKWGQMAAKGTDGEWRALGQFCTQLEQHRPDPTPEITAKAQALVAGAADFYTKLKDITEYIQKNVRYFVVERGIGGWQAHYAAAVFHNSYGDCKDKATLLISMLEAVGIHASYVPVDDRRGVVDPEAPSFYGNHMIAAIEIPADVNDPRLAAVVKANDGKRYLIFDPTNERTPVGNLPSYEQGSYGILAAGADSQVIALPVLPPEMNGAERTGTFTLSADGSLTGTVNVLSTGPKGANIRLSLKYRDEKERRESLEKSVATELPGVVLSSVDFVQPEALEKPLEIRYALATPQYAHSAGTLLLVRPRVVGSMALPVDDKPRTLPIDLDATGRWRDSFDITLPAGYTVDDLPDPLDIDMDFASYHSKTTAIGNVLHYEREFVVRQVVIPASKYQEFRKLEGAIEEDEQSAAVLKKQ
jgi:hypothetical protein